jgi:hypothetical protein
VPVPKAKPSLLGHGEAESWAQEAQVDWYEAWIDLGDERTKVQVFAMRSMASGAAFHRAYLHATQQAFLEALEHAFAYFGGVFHLLRFDNLASAVRKILRGIGVSSAYTNGALRVSTRICSHPRVRPTNEEQGNRSDRDPLGVDFYLNTRGGWVR